MSNKFKPGQSGNPDGRPKGSKDKRTEYREMFQEHAEDLINKAVEMAKGGDSSMMKACLDRIVSPYRAVDPYVKLDDIEGTLTEKGEKIIMSMGSGELSPSDASSMLSALASQSRVIEIDDQEKRLRRLEEKYGN